MKLATERWKSDYTKARCSLSRFFPDDGQAGSYVCTFSGGLRRCCPEVGFGEIAIDLLQARFWTTSELPTNVPRSATVGLGQVTITSTGLDDVRCYSSSRGFSSTHMTCPVLPPDLPK